MSASRDRLSWERSLLVRYKILRLFFNTLTADEKYSRNNRENFPEPIKMRLSKKVKSSFYFFVEFLKFTSIFEHFETKDKCQNLRISEVMESKKRVYLNVSKVII